MDPFCSQINFVIIAIVKVAGKKKMEEEKWKEENEEDNFWTLAIAIGAVVLVGVSLYFISEKKGKKIKKEKGDSKEVLKEKWSNMKKEITQMNMFKNNQAKNTPKLISSQKEQVVKW